jgi:hypothetical protein
MNGTVFACWLDLIRFVRLFAFFLPLLLIDACTSSACFYSFYHRIQPIDQHLEMCASAFRGFPIQRNACFQSRAVE